MDIIGKKVYFHFGFAKGKDGPEREANLGGVEVISFDAETGVIGCKDWNVPSQTLKYLVNWNNVTYAQIDDPNRKVPAPGMVF